VASGADRLRKLVAASSGPDVLAVLETLGIEVVRVEQKKRDPWAMCLCPFHDDHDPSFAVAIDNGYWVCYASCGVGRLAELVARVKGITEAEADVWLGSVQAPDPGNDALRAAIAGPGAVMAERTPEMPEYEHGQTYKYMEGRGFEPATLRAWDVGMDKARAAVVVPITFRGRVEGLVYRYVNPLASPKYVYTAGLKAGEVLFGWDMMPDAPDEIVLVEGPLDAMWLWQCGIPGVALLGAQISRAQASLIAGRTRAVVLALDMDEAGQRGVAQAARLLGHRVRVRAAILPPGKKDVQECGCIELKVVVSQAVDVAAIGLPK
jgi:DNA primase